MPKLIVNEANVYVTDSFYRVNVLDEFNVNDLVFSFYNTLTMVLAELKGRFYGGGVLELISSEFKSLKVPYIERISRGNFQRLKDMIENGSQLADLLDFTDCIILRDGMGFAEGDILRLRSIHKNLVNRRLKRDVL